MKQKILSLLPRPIYYQLSHWQNKKKFDQIRESAGQYSLSGFDDLKCIFVHIPKTGGVSINKALFGNLGGGHQTVRDYKRIFGPLTYHYYFSFAFVRNPFSRVASAYTFLKNGGFNEADQMWFKNNISSYDTFKDFVMLWLNNKNIWTKNHFMPQYHYVYENNKLQVDYIGHFERLHKDYSVVCTRCNIKSQLPHYNSTDNKRKYIDYYDKKTIEKVAQVYKNDFDIFGYNPNDIEALLL